MERTKETLREGLRGVEDQQGRPSQEGQVDFEYVSESRTSLH